MEFMEGASVKKKICCVYNCDSETKRNRKLSFHRFPKKGGRKISLQHESDTFDIHNAWVRRLKLSKSPSKSTKICSMHFTLDDFIVPKCPRLKRMLKRSAVPSVNLPSTPQPKKIKQNPSRSDTIRRGGNYNLELQKIQTSALSQGKKFTKSFNGSLRVPEYSEICSAQFAGNKHFYQQSSPYMSSLFSKAYKKNVVPSIAAVFARNVERKKVAVDSRNIISSTDIYPDNEYDEEILRNRFPGIKTTIQDKDIISSLKKLPNISFEIRQGPTHSEESYFEGGSSHSEHDFDYAAECKVKIDVEDTVVQLPEYENCFKENDSDDECNFKPEVECKMEIDVEDTVVQLPEYENCFKENNLDDERNFKHKVECKMEIDIEDTVVQLPEYENCYKETYSDDERNYKSEVECKVEINVEENELQLPEYGQNCFKEDCGKFEPKTNFEIKVKNEIDIVETAFPPGQEEYYSKEDYPHNDLDANEKMMRLYKCQFCFKQFTKKNDLTIHLQSHNKQFKCDICEKSFGTRFSLGLHKQSHLMDKPHECDVCGNKFTQKGNLKIHQRIHSGEKPFVCIVCSKKFYTSSKLKRHEKVHTHWKNRTSNSQAQLL